MAEIAEHMTATKEGKLFVRASDLFARKGVQQVVLRMANSSVAQQIRRNQKSRESTKLS